MVLILGWPLSEVFCIYTSFIFLKSDNIYLYSVYIKHTFYLNIYWFKYTADTVCWCPTTWCDRVHNMLFYIYMWLGLGTLAVYVANDLSPKWQDVLNSENKRLYKILWWVIPKCTVWVALETWWFFTDNEWRVCKRNK